MKLFHFESFFFASTLFPNFPPPALTQQQCVCYTTRPRDWPSNPLGEYWEARRAASCRHTSFTFIEFSRRVVGLRFASLASLGSRWVLQVLAGSRWVSLGLASSRWFSLVPAGSRWVSRVLARSRWVSLVLSGSRWFSPVLAGSR